ncbi:hypothetical protein BJP50_31045 [Paenibacillus odorifer]|nr:hypothetical protein BJP50_31045 [Paenibacillus odorifer]
MKKIIPSIILSLLSFPLANLMLFIYFKILPPYGSSEIALLSCVISINFISFIIAFYAVIDNKNGR